MALTVNTNIASLTAQRNLTSSQNMLSTSLERLSSGLRINSAKDDAAGLAISERFNAQIRGLNQGVRNANDGISLAQTAEGALKEVTSNLQRIRELAVQSANATNSTSDRAALQAEVAQLVAEIDRVAVNTKFNGNSLLDGSFTSKAFQVGAEVGETVTISSIASTRTSALGSTNAATATGNADVNATAITAASLYINGTEITASVSDGVSPTGTDDYSAAAKAAAINASTSTHGVTATATNTFALTSTTTGDTSVTAGGGAAAASIGNADLAINGTDLGAITIGANASDNGDAIANAVNAIASTTGVTATNAAGVVTLSASDGRNIVVGAGSSGTTAAIDFFSFGQVADQAGTTDVEIRGELALSSNSASGIQISTTASGAAASNAVLGMTSGNFSVAASGSGVALSVASVATVDSANLVITGVDNALTTINTIRADLGSYQNRFESVVSSLQTTAENLSASRSRIVDADFASETAQLTKAQILQQSGIAMLAQANAIPQNVLALLQ